MRALHAFVIARVQQSVGTGEIDGIVDDFHPVVFLVVEPELSERVEDGIVLLIVEVVRRRRRFALSFEAQRLAFDLLKGIFIEKRFFRHLDA